MTGVQRLARANRKSLTLGFASALLVPFFSYLVALSFYPSVMAFRIAGLWSGALVMGIGDIVFNIALALVYMMKVDASDTQSD